MLFVCSYGKVFFLTKKKQKTKKATGLGHFLWKNIHYTVRQTDKANGSQQNMTTTTTINTHTGNANPPSSYGLHVYLCVYVRCISLCVCVCVCVFISGTQPSANDFLVFVFQYSQQ